MRKFFVSAGATVIYWSLLMLIPPAIMLINSLAYQHSGFGWADGDTFYNILSTMKQPLACFVAFSAAQYICSDSASWCPFVNASFSSFFFVLLTFCAGTAWEVVEMGLSAAMCIASFSIQRKEIIRIAVERVEEELYDQV